MKKNNLIILVVVSVAFQIHVFVNGNCVCNLGGHCNSCGIIDGSICTCISSVNKGSFLTYGFEYQSESKKHESILITSRFIYILMYFHLRFFHIKIGLFLKNLHSWEKKTIRVSFEAFSIGLGDRLKTLAG